MKAGIAALFLATGAAHADIATFIMPVQYSDFQMRQLEKHQQIDDLDRWLDNYKLQQRQQEFEDATRRRQEEIENRMQELENQQRRLRERDW